MQAGGLCWFVEARTDDENSTNDDMGNCKGVFILRGNVLYCMNLCDSPLLHGIILIYGGIIS